MFPTIGGTGVTGMEFSVVAMGQLREFGLSAYASRAYLALLELGVAEARGVSQLANIPTAKVYGTLVQLQRRGLAEVTPGKPRTYAPVPMEEFLERQLQEKEEQTLDLRARKDRLVEMFPITGTGAVTRRAQTVTVAGRRNIVQHLREACAASQESILAILAAPLRDDATTRRLFEQAAARGIEVRLLDDAAPLRHVAAAPQSYLVATFDDRIAMLVHLGTGRRLAGQPDDTAIHTTDPAFVLPLRGLLAAHRAEQDAADRSERGVIVSPRAQLAAASVDSLRAK